jgi:hypothetical protein
MILVEIKNLLKEIEYLERILDCYNVKLFYLNTKTFECEFDENENRIQIIKTKREILIAKNKLQKLNTNLIVNFEILNESENG